MLKALRGTKDILPEDIGIWQKIESFARDMFSIYGYREIRTPIIEEASLFIRSIGDTTDIVQKEMYIFSDKGGRDIALRPEATASIVRAYIENSIGSKEGLSKLFYIGPMFRSERPQKGRQRQFHQLGIEAVGSDNPLLDVEVISLAVRLLESLGVKNFSLNINSLGCQKDKVEMIKNYRRLIKPFLSSLCDECKSRYNKNVLRVLDCKNSRCREAIRKIDLSGLLCKECEGHFRAVKKGLDKSGISYTVDSRIVRGLDYYTKTVFEITQGDLGAKDAVCAGGRYNGLIKEMGGKDTPAIGFAFGIERLAMALTHNLSTRAPEHQGTRVFIAVTGETFYNEAFKLLDSLRSAKISSEMDYEGKSLKAQMRRAERVSARFVVIFGEKEFKQGKIVLRDMKGSTQKEVEFKNIAEEITKGLGET